MVGMLVPMPEKSYLCLVSRSFHKLVRCRTLTVFQSKNLNYVRFRISPYSQEGRREGDKDGGNGNNAGGTVVRIGEVGFHAWGWWDESTHIIGLHVVL